MKQLANIYEIDLENNIIIVYGEWCGGKIQKHVAITNLDPMFVIFDIATNINDDKLKWFDISDCKVQFPNEINNEDISPK